MLNKKVSQNDKEVGYIKNIASEVGSIDQFVSQYLKPLLHNDLGIILSNSKSLYFSNFDILAFLSLLPLLGLTTINSCYMGAIY